MAKFSTISSFFVSSILPFFRSLILFQIRTKYIKNFQLSINLSNTILADHAQFERRKLEAKISLWNRC